MPLADAAGVEQGAVIEADVCVVGAGPAGLALALELAASGVRVSLLESGGLSGETEAAAELDAIEGSGPLRGRRFGGTAWYGRCVTLDAIDFEERPWVPRSGWPIARSEVESRYARAARFLGIRTPAALAATFWDSEPAFQALHGGGLAPRVHLISSATQLGKRYRHAVASSTSVRALLHATVVGIEARDRTVAALRVRGPGGQEFSSCARRYVLACGGVENARLLLVLEAENPGVLGPSCEAIGRCYMDHPRCDGLARLHLDPRHTHDFRTVRRLTEHRSRASRCRVQLAVGIDEDTQRREELLNASAFFYIASAPRLRDLRAPFDALAGSVARRRFGRDDVGSVRRLARELPLLARAGLARLRRRPFMIDHLVMVEQLEQTPDPRSRVTLSARRDRFGTPLPRLEWRIGADTVRTQRRFHELLKDRMRVSGVGQLHSGLLDDPDLEPAYGDSAHPMGATCMAVDPRRGVVAGDCRVHTFDNLYVAGSSVFPTGGHANPTLPLVALALRLADHLSARLRSEL